jgi:hypothetical protein
MTPNCTNSDRPQLKTTGAHRRRRKHRSALTRTVAVGGAAICIGVAYDLSTPTADALSILLPGRTVNGVGNTTRINIFEGNIFMPQFGLGGNVSNNSTVGNVAIGNGNNIISQLLNTEIRLGGTVGNGNTTQINLFSYNIFNPQWGLGGNVSNNSSIGNVAMNNGNNSSASTSMGSLFPWLGGQTGNGNTFQFAFFSGNIFNPQYSIGGNVSNNTTVSNAAINNGNSSHTAATPANLLTGLLGGWTGNGNTFQLGFFVSNIFNPQYSFGGGNTSNNSATTNTASGNGNNSTTGSGGSGVGGTTGNGNTTQVAGGSGNIINDQVNVGVNLLHSNGTASSNQQQSLAVNTVGSNNSNSTGAGSINLLRSNSTASDNEQQSVDPNLDSSNESNSTGSRHSSTSSTSSTSPVSPVSSTSTASGTQQQSLAPRGTDTSAPSSNSTNDTGSASHTGSDGDGGG